MASDGLSAGERTATAREIAEVAEELGHSLSDIVWALDPQTSSLEELGARLAEHGERLFPDEGVRFEASLPQDWPQVTSSVAVRRNLLLIGLEALHNAARHAEARSVTLRIAPLSKGEWEMEVRDDGRGIGSWPRAGRSGSGGRGLPGLARRAEAIGAVLDVRSEAGGGTTIAVRFRPRGERARGLVHSVGTTVRDATRMIMRRR
jgi:signal transduction histidine kinase